MTLLSLPFLRGAAACARAARRRADALDWWPPGLWWGGRCWGWQQRLLAWARLPVRRGGWQSDPWQRAPARRLGLLAFLLGFELGLWWALRRLGA